MSVFRFPPFNLQYALKFLGGLDVDCKNCGCHVSTSLTQRDETDGTCSVNVTVNDKRGYHYGIFCSGECAIQMIKKADKPEKCPGCRSACVAGPGTDPAAEMIITDILVEKIKFRFICCSKRCAESIGNWPAWRVAAPAPAPSRPKRRPAPQRQMAGGWSRAGRRPSADDNVFCDACGNPSDSTAKCPSCNGRFCSKCMDEHIASTHQ